MISHWTSSKRKRRNWSSSSVTQIAFWLRTGKTLSSATVNWRSSTRKCGRTRMTGSELWLVSALLIWLGWLSSIATISVRLPNWHRNIWTITVSTTTGESIRDIMAYLAISRFWTSSPNYPISIRPIKTVAAHRTYSSRCFSSKPCLRQRWTRRS